MEDEFLKKMLAELGNKFAGQAEPGLAQKIKDKIPVKLSSHTFDSIKIVIDFRINKITAAAAIILSSLILAGIFGLRDTFDEGIIKESKMLIKYALTGEQGYATDLLASDVPRLYKMLKDQGKEVVYYGNKDNIGDGMSILMYWKLSDSRYSVVFGDLSTDTINAKTLILFQTYMLQKDAPK